MDYGVPFSDLSADDMALLNTTLTRLKQALQMRLLKSDPGAWTKMENLQAENNTKIRHTEPVSTLGNRFSAKKFSDIENSRTEIPRSKRSTSAILSPRITPRLPICSGAPDPIQPP